MDKAFRLSLLYLLLIIPQHGNSPIPKMESWMEMDQGDGFVDRELTSSLTGAESFGSAHKNYQNALIQKKQANFEDELLHDKAAVDKFSGRIFDRMERGVAITPNLMDNQFATYECNNFLAESRPSQRISQDSGRGMNGYQDQRSRIQLSNGNTHASNSKFDKKFYGSRPADVIDSPLTAIGGRSLQTEIENSRNEEGDIASRSRLAKCFLGETEKFDLDGATSDALSDDEESADDTGGEETTNLVKNGLNEDYLADMPVEGGDGRDRVVLRYNSDREEDLGSDESDYYGDVINPASARDKLDNLDVEYAQINPDRIIYKREESKMHGGKTAVDGEEISPGFLKGDSKIRSVKKSRSGNLLRAEAPKEGLEITKDDAKGKLQNSEDTENVLRSSRKTSDKMLVSRGKSEMKPEYIRENVKWNVVNFGKVKKREPKEKKNKREDEDEQKNMKTGTDEGGGEYEDEEGKGHNDEEEYYEEGEISTGEITADTPSSDYHSKRNLYKRETGEDEEEKGKKEREGNSNVSLDEYQLNLENAPVEHEGSSKKSPSGEGKTREKSVARRGMKIWDEWGKWSPCSVTCGVGRKTRWRHCIGGGCARGEKEALIKTCTYPAC